MKVYLEFITTKKRVLLGEADTLDELERIKLNYISDSYEMKRYYDRYWVSHKELINDFGSHCEYIIFSDLTKEILQQLKIESKGE